VSKCQCSLNLGIGDINIDFILTTATIDKILIKMKIINVPVNIFFMLLIDHVSNLMKLTGTISSDLKIITFLFYYCLINEQTSLKVMMLSKL
jgi:hypothetical protein